LPRTEHLNHPVHTPGNCCVKCRTSSGISLGVPQGRDMHGKDIQAKEEIRSELLLAHHRFEIAVVAANQTSVV